MGIAVSVLMSRYRDEYDPEILGVFTSHDTMRVAFDAVLRDAMLDAGYDTESAWDELMSGGFQNGRTSYWYENHTLDRLSVGLLKEVHRETEEKG